jgi:alkanesulfonate monooxygenase SsuD/methylene tetrahydromethanopterin reductase-like flavin-dependent oxidoreductase (luciferase family)
MSDNQGSTSGLGRFGVWVGAPVTPDAAQAIEKLGYGALWVGGSPNAELTFVEPILKQTTSLVVATGIVNIWSAPAKTVAESFHRIEAAYPAGSCLVLAPVTASTPPTTANRMTRSSTTSTSWIPPRCQPPAG